MDKKWWARDGLELIDKLLNRCSKLHNRPIVAVKVTAKVPAKVTRLKRWIWLDVIPIQADRKGRCRSNSVRIIHLVPHGCDELWPKPTG